MKNTNLKQTLLTKQELNLNNVIQEYILKTRKAQFAIISDQAPNIIGKQYNFFLSLVITAAIVLLNYDQLFIPEKGPVELIPFKSFNDLQKKVEFVFEHTLIKYSIVYPFNITECESIIPFIKSDTLCSEKSIQAKIRFTFGIGYRPDYDNLQFNPKNGTITGDYGTLQILNIADERLIETQSNGLFNKWSIVQFEKKYEQIKQVVRPKLQKRVDEYIANYTQNQNSVDTFQQNIKRSLMAIMRNKYQAQQPLQTRILKFINQGFDKLLILISMDPFFFTQSQKVKDQFSQQHATEFFKEQIIIGQEKSKIDNQIAEKINSQKKSKTQENVQTQKAQEKSDRNEAEKYDTKEMVQKYNELLKKSQMKR